MGSTQRQCGACQLCCVLPAITQLNKPANVPCKHLTAKGCGIYETRPDVCRKFRCHWLDGIGSERPDVVGAYSTPMPEGNGWLGKGILVTLEPGRFGRHAQVQQATLDALDAGGEVLMISGETRRLVTRDRATLNTAAVVGLKDQDGRPVIAERA